MVKGCLKESFLIGDSWIGPGAPCFVIAEAGVNHNGDLQMAFRLIDAAVEAEADAVKFQTFKAEKVVIRNAPKADYQKVNTGNGDSQFEMIKKLELSEEAHREIKRYCDRKGIIFLSTPFDDESADFLAALGVPAFKIASGEITNLSFLDHVARKGRPLIISTGMSTLVEVEAAVQKIKNSGATEAAFLHCVSSYPAPSNEVNLRAMATMRDALKVPIGYSDHTSGIEVSLAAVALGACIIEKHFTLDRSLPGPDHKASLEPQELKALVQGIRQVEGALGHGRKEPAPCEQNTREVARRSLVAASRIPIGVQVTEAMITVKRPGTGLAPELKPMLVGKKALRDIPEGELFSMEMLG